MKLYNGNCIVDGIVLGKILIYKKNNIQIQKIYIDNVNKEIDRLKNAINEVSKELDISYEYALNN